MSELAMAPPSSTELSEDHEEWLREHLGDFRDADDTKAKEDIVKDVTAKFCKKFSIPDRGAKAWHKPVKDFMYKYGRKREHRGHKRWTKKLTIRTIIGTFKHEEVALAQTKGKIGTYQSALSYVQEQLTEAEEKTYQEILEAWEKDGIPEEKQRE
ncbi:hypothetical protein DENSPDRAFT_854908 [Dentipellis sp. KUC8613]|nr:hypothetical protein DENSPDRAFT_854908 [Dentipellis sp. KUC8613]